MFASKSRQTNGRRLLRTVVLTAALAIPSFADTRLRIASVRPELLVTAGPQRMEPTPRHTFEFEVDKETGRARIVIDYIYPGVPIFGSDEGPAAAPITAQIPGLRYDAATRAVVYEKSGNRTVCANVRDRKMLFWKTEAIVPTGACTVSAELVSRVEDTGWRPRQVSTLDTYFKVDQRK